MLCKGCEDQFGANMQPKSEAIDWFLFLVLYFAEGPWALMLFILLVFVLTGTYYFTKVGVFKVIFAFPQISDFNLFSVFLLEFF